MVWFNIISQEEFENCWGTITHKGDIIETTEHENILECKRYVKEQYGPRCNNIKVTIRRA